MKQHPIDPIPTLAGRAARALLRHLGVHPQLPAAEALAVPGGRALCVATNHGVLDVGVPTGVYASELTVPYYAFLDAGMQVDLCSPRGGIVPVEPLSLRPSLRTPADDRLLDDVQLKEWLGSSLPAESTDFASYDLVYFAGGWGAAFDLGQSEVIGRRVSEAFAAGRVLGGICHGPLGLLRGRRPDGRPLVAGRRLTAVTDRQVQQLGVAITPLHPESALRAAGAQFECVHHPVRDFLANHVVRDGDLITGQNQNAGEAVARAMLARVLELRRDAAASD
jgi:putative intracellular protease/amidase